MEGQCRSWSASWPRFGETDVPPFSVWVDVVSPGNSLQKHEAPRFSETAATKPRQTSSLPNQLVDKGKEAQWWCQEVPDSPVVTERCC
jgi:hypothetical protein